MDEKKFTKMITRMFDKQSILKDLDTVVTDGFLLYRGELKNDIFYRLRLEATGQTELLPQSIESIFGGMEDYEEVDLNLLYTVPGYPKETDVYAVGIKDPKPYIGFSIKYRKLFTELEDAVYKTKFIEVKNMDKPTLLYSVHIECQFGEIIAMPKRLDEQYILVPRK